MSAPLIIDDDTLTVPVPLDDHGTYDVVINDIHCWSFTPERDAIARPRHATVVRWPKGMRRYLVGTADVLVRAHGSETELAAGHHIFHGEADQRVSITDQHGDGLVLDKYGRLTRPLSADGAEETDAFLAQIDDLLTVLREKAGVDSFIAYGTLLGAVRNGRLIGHDNDVDVAYVSLHRYPVDVIAETFAIERILTAEGWLVRRGSGTRLNVRLRQPNGSVRYVDIFTAHWVGERLFIPQDTGFELPTEAILPLTTVELHGRQFPAPADSERLLALTYGPKWRTPDPSFKYETPRWLGRRLGGWFGGLRTDRKVWDAFYARKGGALPMTPSPFAQWVNEHYPSTGPLVDLGTGNGRDAVYFAELGREVIAVDYALGIMKRQAQRATVKGWPQVRREVLNFNDSRHTMTLGYRLSRTDEPADLFGRFLLHALDSGGVDNVLRLASMSLRRGGHLFVEFRTEADRPLPHKYANAKRRFLNPDDIVARISERGGRVVERHEGMGLARFRGENPHVCRLVVSFAGSTAAAQPAP